MYTTYVSSVVKSLYVHYGRRPLFTSYEQKVILIVLKTLK